MVGVVSIPIGAARMTRVPYFDVGLPGEGFDLGPAELEVASAEPWVDPQRQPLVGVAAWVIESAGRRIVVDPLGAADAFIRTGSEGIEHQENAFAAFAEAGFPRETVDTVLLSHLDGIGLVAALTADLGWEPAFPNARVVLGTVEAAHLASRVEEVQGIEAWDAVVAAGVVDPVPDGTALTPEVTLVHTGGHGEGHCVVRVESAGELAVLVGHLAISPLHIAKGIAPGQHLFPEQAWTALSGLVKEARDRGSVLAGPLWPAPGAARIDDAGVPRPVG